MTLLEGATNSSQATAGPSPTQRAEVQRTEIFFRFGGWNNAGFEAKTSPEQRTEIERLRGIPQGQWPEEREKLADIRPQALVDELRQVVEMVRKMIEGLKLTEATRESLRFNAALCIEELLANQVLHGNRCDPRKPVEGKLIIQEGADLRAKRVLFISHAPEAVTFDPAKVADPRSDENIKKVSGRGIFLMQSYSSKLRWFNKGRGCIVAFSPDKVC